MIETRTSSFQSVKRMVPAFGTFIRIELCSDTVPSEVLLAHLGEMMDSIRWVEKTMSYRNEASELTTLNHAPVGEWVKVSARFFEALEFAERLRAESEGLFNIGFFDGWSGRFLELSPIHCEARKLVPGEIDLGGITKGYAVDCAFSAIEGLYEEGRVWGSIRADGDVFLFERADVNLAIQVNVDEGVDHRIISLKRGAIATSVTRTDTELRYSHRDRKGNRLESSKTVSVFANSARLADALTKVMLAAESENEMRVARKCLARFSAEGYCELHEQV